MYLKVEGREKPTVDLHEKQEANVLFFAEINHYWTCDVNTVIFSQIMAKIML